MISRAFLLTRPNVSIPIRALERAEGTLFCLAAYGVFLRDGVHSIALTRLRSLPGQCGRGARVNARRRSPPSARCRRPSVVGLMITLEQDGKGAPHSDASHAPLAAFQQGE
jgi:hypothetical protein